jgi:hypothetical protein
MVKPPLRTKSIGFKVSEEEYAQLETAGAAPAIIAGTGLDVLANAGCATVGRQAARGK